MAKVKFFLLDADYGVEAGKAVLYLYGRSTDGNRICVKDAGLEPYFFVAGKKDGNLAKDIDGFAVERAKVVRVEKVKRNLNERPAEMLKVVADLPSSVPALREALRRLPSVKDVYEADILFVRRYLLDKQLMPMTLLEAECDPVAAESRVPVLLASSVKQSSDEAIAPKVLAIDIEVYNPTGKRVIPEQHPIVMLSLYGEGLRKVLTWKQIKGKDIEALPSEAAMLERAKELIESYQPDILTGYYSDGFDLPYIKARCDKHRIKLDLGWDFSEMRVSSKGATPSCGFTGLVHIDVLRFIRTVMGKSMKTDTFTLDAVASELLGEQKKDVDIERLAEMWDSNDPALSGFAAYNLHDSKLTHDLCTRIMPNIIEMIRLVGVLPFDACRMPFSQLVEWYIIRQAVLASESIPNKPERREQESREIKRFQGAFVFEPKPGLYNDIVVFDYRSLYPSIIASHNISPGTLRCSCCEGKEMVPETQLWFCTQRRGFLSRIIEDIVTHRARIKKMLKEDRNPLLAARSEGLKVLANAFYGYLGFAPARWYCFECGESVTAWGRHHIRQVMEQAQKAGFVVVYGDTDSCMLLLNGKTKEDALRFMEQVNASLPGLMELELEDFYPSGLFVPTKAAEQGAKKRYALLDQKGRMKIRGFEVVRRNVSPVAKQVQEEVLRIILTEKAFDKARQLVNDIVRRLRANEIPVSDVIITTQLTKSISEYESIGPHVAAAQRMVAQKQEMGPGSRIEYVIIKGKQRELIRDKVRLPQEIRQEDYDGDYYVHHQVLPAVEKIFQVVGVDINKATAHKEQKTLEGF